MKSSKYYQGWLQLISRGSDIFLFLSGYFLGTGNTITATIMLFFKLITGYATSELMYKRMKAVIEERQKIKEERGNE